MTETDGKHSELELSAEELERMLEQASRPGLFLRKTPNADGPGVSGCWLGGEPKLPPEIDWPWYETDDIYSAPMHFLAQIDLAQVPNSQRFPDLPQSGTLFFFHDPIFAPVFGLRDGGSKVLFVERNVSGYPPRPTPSMPDVMSNNLVSYVYKNNRTQGYPKWPFHFEDYEYFDETLFVNEQFWKAALRRCSSGFKGLRKKTEIDREPPEARRWSDYQGCSKHFALHSMYSGSTYPASEGAQDFLPLFIAATDDDISFQHGDCEAAVFWISKGDLRKRNFDGAFLQTAL